MKKINILFIGCGRTCKAIIESIKNLPFIGQIYREGRNVFSVNSQNKFENIIKNIDVVVITLAGQKPEERRRNFLKFNTNKDVRYAELEQNIKEIDSILPSLKLFPKNISIIIITNPVDILVNYLRISLKRNNIIGFGLSSDCDRYKNNLTAYKDFLCVGVHGDSFPVLNKDKRFYDSIFKKVDIELLNEVRKNDIQFNFVGDKFKEFLVKFTSNNIEVIHCCYYVKKINSVENFSVSIPFYVQKMKILEPVELKLNREEKALFEEKVEFIKKEIYKLKESYIFKVKNWYDRAYYFGKERRKKGFGWPLEVEKTEKDFIEFVVKNGKTNLALDVGCGDGRHTEYLSDLFRHVVGVDVSEEAIKLTADKINNKNNITLINGNILDFNCSDNFDLIIDSSVMTHLQPDDLNKYADKVYNLTAKNGFLILVVFSKDNQFVLKNEFKKHEGQYFLFFDRRDIQKIFNKFSIIKVVNSMLELEKESKVFKGKMNYKMTHYLLQRN